MHRLFSTPYEIGFFEPLISLKPSVVSFGYLTHLPLGTCTAFSVSVSRLVQLRTPINAYRKGEKILCFLSA